MTDPGCYNTPDDLAPAPDPEPPPDADLRLSSPELLISYTLFRDTSAMSPIERADVPWPTLVAHLKAAPIYAGKAHCPLISLSEYGDKPSPKGSLRHAANVLRCCGAELDYDGLKVSPAQAAALLEAAHIEAAIYTTPSHTADAPRWRVLLPFSEPALPEKRAEYLGRANRILGGAASRESFTPSQSFYVGRVPGVEYEVLETHGRCIDMAAEIEPLYHVNGRGNGATQWDETSDEELRAAFARGEDRYGAMLKLSARWAARGMAADDIENALSAMLGQGNPKNADGVDLRTRIRPLAESAVRKFGETRKPAQKATEAPDDSEEKPPPLFDANRARVRATFLTIPPDPVEMVVANLMRRTAGVRVSAGGVGKSTLTLFEMICIILGCDLYGREVMRPGPCVLVTAEDERAVVEWRLWRTMEDMRLSRPQREQVSANLYIEDMTEKPCRFVDVGEHGSLIQTLAVAEVIEAYRDIKPSFVSIDPMNFFGPGERFVNDGEGELMRAGRRISAGLNAAVRFEHHTGKHQARDRNTDQYSGRGGSAGADNARFVHVLQVHEPENKLMVPKRCTPEDIAKGNVLRLHIAKDSYGARSLAPVWILRTGFLFTHVKPDPAEDIDPMEEQLRKLYAFIEAQGESGIRHTANSLDSRLEEIALSRRELRATLHVALERKHLLEQALPKAEQSGRRKSYLARGLRP